MQDKKIVSEKKEINREHSLQSGAILERLIKKLDWYLKKGKEMREVLIIPQ